MARMNRAPRLSVPEVGRHLGTLVRQGRLAEHRTARGVADDAGVSLATLKRIEAGSLSVSLESWLVVLQAVCLLQRLAALRDPIAEHVLQGTGARRGGRRRLDVRPARSPRG